MNQTDFLAAHVAEKLKSQNSSIPLYIRFANSIKSAVEEGLVEENDFIPTERFFCENAGVSRSSVRKGLEILERDGIITKKHGVGTMIAVGAKLHLKDAQSFSQKIISSGRKPNTIWIEKTHIPADEHVAKHFNIEKGELICQLRRIRSIDDSPVSIEESYVPTALISSFEEVESSLFEFFKSKGLIPAKMDSRVTAEKANDLLVQEINFDKDQPMLVIKNYVYLADGTPIEYSVNYCRGDLYEFIT